MSNICNKKKINIKLINKTNLDSISIISQFVGVPTHIYEYYSSIVLPELLSKVPELDNVYLYSSEMYITIFIPLSDQEISSIE